MVEDFSGAMVFAPQRPGSAFAPGGREGHAWLGLSGVSARSPEFVRNRTPYAPAIDARDRFVKVWVWVEDVGALGGMEFRLSSDGFASNFFAFPLRLYSDPEFNLLADRTWTRLTFSFGAARVVGEPDRGAIDSLGWYVAGAEGAAAHVRWGGLALVDGPAEGVASLTFDDGYDEHHAAARQMAKYGFPGTAYVIPQAIGQPGYLKPREVVELQERYGWDVASHHETPFTQMDPQRLEESILGVRRSLDRWFGARAGGHLAYPLGKQASDRVRAQTRKHFDTARVAALGPETLPPADWHLLRVFNVLDTTTPEEVGAAARSARAHGEWLILMFHYLVDEPASEIEYRAADFDRLLQAIHESGIRVLPVSRVWQACGGARPDGAACTLPDAVPARRR